MCWNLSAELTIEIIQVMYEIQNAQWFYLIGIIERDRYVKGNEKIEKNSNDFK